MKMEPREKQLIDRLYDEQYEQLLMYARSVLSNITLAEDAVQETFRIACSKAEVLAASPNPPGWLFQTLRNTMRNIKRSQYKLMQIVVYSSSVDWVDRLPDNNPSEIDVDVLYGDLAEMDEFILLKKVYIDGKSLNEVASEYGISTNTCKQRVHRAKAKLRDIFEKRK